MFKCPKPSRWEKEMAMPETGVRTDYLMAKK